MLYLYNSLTKTKEVLQTIQPNCITMYVCGVTVYDHCHLGHARCMLVFDMMRRYFKHLGYQVKFVSNITDIDDKIIHAAQKKSCDFHELSQIFIHSMHEDVLNLGVTLPDVEPRATECIDDMLAMIQTLLDRGYAYQSGGDVCFAVEKFSEYGKLSKQNIQQLLAGTRAETHGEKHNAIDFVLWKGAKSGEPYWDSPWGKGRPGWHIECSAMVKRYLGASIDIHGGGLDLQFPHHENEIAQSEACHQQTFAKYWLHVGLLQMDHEKMSKSTGNFLSIKDALKIYHPEVIRLFFMSAHYRSPLNFSKEALEQAQKTLLRLYQTVKIFEQQSRTSSLEQSWIQQFEEAMNDDFNTPQALVVLYELSSCIHKQANASLLHTLLHLAQILGLLQANATEFLQYLPETSAISKTEIETLIQERQMARTQKLFAKADAIRAQLQQYGIELEDELSGTSWRRIY